MSSVTLSPPPLSTHAELDLADRPRNAVYDSDDDDLSSEDISRMLYDAELRMRALSSALVTVDAAATTAASIR